MGDNAKHSARIPSKTFLFPSLLSKSKEGGRRRRACRAASRNLLLTQPQSRSNGALHSFIRPPRVGEQRAASHPGPAPLPLPAAMLLKRIWAGLSLSWYEPRVPPELRFPALAPPRDPFKLAFSGMTTPRRLSDASDGNGSLAPR